MLLKSILLVLSVLSFGQLDLYQRAGGVNALNRGDPLCGVQCIYIVSRMLGCKTDYASLLRAEYIGSEEGSSLRELAQAARHAGLFARPATRLTNWDILYHDGYAILLIRSHVWSERTDHYVLLVNNGGHSYTLVDPVNGAEDNPDIADVLRRWEGAAVFVGKAPISAWSVAIRGWGLFAAVLLLACVMGWAGTLKSAQSISAIRQCIMLLCFASCLGFGYHGFSATGYWGRDDAIRQIREWHTDEFLKVASRNQLLKALNYGKAIIVDARSTAEFEAGHIPTARSLPWNMIEHHRTALTDSKNHSVPVIVYCSNPKCHNSHRVAQAFLSSGFVDVSVYSGGWEEWVLSRREIK